MNLYCCSTKYHILLSALIAYQNREDNNVLVVETNGFAGSEKLKEGYENAIFNEIILLRNAGDKLKNAFGYLTYKRSITKALETDYPRLGELRKQKGEITCYLCEDGHHFSRYFIYHFDTVIMLEEGMQIYKPVVRFESKLKQLLKYRMLGIIRPNGRDGRIKEVWVQHPERLPVDIRDKGRVLHLKELLASISGTCWMRTLEEMLGFDETAVNKVTDSLSSIREECQLVLLVTQPFSEDGLIDEEGKITIYRRILESIHGRTALIIKPHPREKTRYGALFPDATVLDNRFPLELIRFVFDGKEQPIDYALTVDSTAVMNIQDLCGHVRAFGLCEITKDLSKKYPMELGYEI